MNHRWYVLMTAATLIGTVTLAACAAAPDSPTQPGKTPPPTTEQPSGYELARADVSQELNPDVDADDLTQLAQDNNAFALDLYHQLTDESSENVIFSPFSISLALAMTYGGAEGTTEEQMSDTLHFDLPEDRLHSAFNALSQGLEPDDGSTPEGGEGKAFELNVANATWGQMGYPFARAYLELLARHYGAGMRLMDFATDPEAARETINNWVEEQTEDRIQDLVPSGMITPSTRLVLTNAIYFNASWYYPFNEEATQEGDFTLLDGSTVTVPMMRQHIRLSYNEGSGYKAVRLPYTGNEIAMTVILPDEGTFETFEDTMDAATLDAILNGFSEAEVEITMPRWEYRSDFALNETLAAMGMPVAFSGEADFSGMVEGSDNPGLYISDVVHKAFIKVDEAGTEAAAATAVAVAESAVGQTGTITLDRPFIYVITDQQTQSVLFMGRVMNPEG